MVKHLFDNGTVLDCTGASPRRDHSVFTEGNRIRKMGPAPEVRAFAEEQGAYRTIDAKGMTIMPGIVDSHCHPSYNEVTSVEALDMYGSAEYRTLKAALAIRKILRAGVTTVGSPGGTWKINVALRDAVNAGLIEGPRMVGGRPLHFNMERDRLVLPDPHAAPAVLLRSGVQHPRRDGRAGAPGDQGRRRYHQDIR